VPCKSWPIRRIKAEVVEGYLRRRKQAGLSGYYAFVALRTLMNWAVKKKYLPTHDLDSVDPALRRKGRRHYLPADEDVLPGRNPLRTTYLLLARSEIAFAQRKGKRLDGLH
jgi:hypothetical protein